MGRVRGQRFFKLTYGLADTFLRGVDVSQLAMQRRRPHLKTFAGPHLRQQSLDSEGGLGKVPGVSKCAGRREEFGRVRGERPGRNRQGDGCNEHRRHDEKGAIRHVVSHFPFFGTIPDWNPVVGLNP